MSSAGKSFTGSGNLKAPDGITCVQWVKKAWSTVFTDVIVKSSKACGITSTTGVPEDDSIHCLKPGGVAHSALDSIRQGTASLNSISELEEDPIADCDLETEEEPSVTEDE